MSVFFVSKKPLMPIYFEAGLTWPHGCTEFKKVASKENGGAGWVENKVLNC